MLLVMDNCPAHVPIDSLPELANVKVLYLPPNTTSRIQPCDAGIIRTLKAYYRKIFNRNLLRALELDETLGNVEAHKKVDVLKAMVWAVEAWNMVTKETICNCFNHCKVRTSSLNVQVPARATEPPANVADDLMLQNDQLYRNPIDINAILNNPLESEVAYSPDVEDIVAVTMEEHGLSLPIEVEGGIPDEDDSEVPAPVKAKDVLDAIRLCKLYFMQRECDTSTTHRKLNEVLEDFERIHITGKKQVTLHQFLSKAAKEV